MELNLQNNERVKEDNDKTVGKLRKRKDGKGETKTAQTGKGKINAKRKLNM